MADRAAGRRSSDGIHGAILGTGVGSTGAVLETDLPETRRHWPNLGSATFGASTIESRSTRAQEGFSRCRTFGKATGGQRADPEFCARRRTAIVAHGHTPKVPADPGQGAIAESTGSSARRGSY